MSTGGTGALARFELDHLVVAATSLAAGREWCEATFGVLPQTGGKHPSMATHNLLLSLASPRFPRAYLEIIAIDPEASAPSRRRWYDLDDPALQAAIAGGPSLVHWVVRAADIDAEAGSLRRLGHDVGAIIVAERQTARGRLRWRITVPADGRRPAAGAVPLLISWCDEHPSSSLAASGVVIEAVTVGGIDAALACELGAIAGELDAPPLVATLGCLRGRLTMASPAAV